MQGSTTGHAITVVKSAMRIQGISMEKCRLHSWLTRLSPLCIVAISDFMGVEGSKTLSSLDAP